MELARAILFVLLALVCGLAQARTSMRRAPKDVDLKALQVHVSPELEESDKHFFKKDYPWDKRPKADPFHFKHPYPVVQDSGEFDRDFVKDENSDNGYWKAQMTYDRLRAKLRKEKKDLAKALAKKLAEEQEVEDAMKHHAREEKLKNEAAQKADRMRHEEEQRRTEDDEERRRESHAHHEHKDADDKEKEKKTKSRTDAGDEEESEDRKSSRKTKPVGKDVDVSTEETEKAMDKLEECKKELAKARQQLKDLMKELEEAKKKQNAANDKLDDAKKHESSEKEHEASSKKQAASEYEEYQEARKAYLKQQAIVEKLQKDIKVAAAKVKAIRDSADKDGGVYPTPDQAHKSSALATHSMWALSLAIAARWAQA